MKPIYQAILRALAGAFLTGASVGLFTYQTSSNGKTAGVAAGAAFVSYLMVRGGFEGVADQVRT